MDDGVLNQRLANLETGVGAATQLADHAIKRAAVLEAALAIFAKHAVIDFGMLKAAVYEDYSDASPKLKAELDTIIDELRSRI